ncbi:hypothetical protein EDB80DRAFT_877548 [Ilyonectria destructans]|nr:hypothetical protein EDB80DRAFT_877548 [Ilyonectria destructans]
MDFSGHYDDTSPDSPNPLLLGAVTWLNHSAALTMRPRCSTASSNLCSLSPSYNELRFKGGSQLQIVESMALVQPFDLKKFQYARVCREERWFFVWQGDNRNANSQATSVEERSAGTSPAFSTYFIYSPHPFLARHATKVR